MKVTVVQPNYYAGEDPAARTADFLRDCLQQVQEGELIVLPEYSNAGGLSDPDQERAAMPRAKELLSLASSVAGRKKAYVAINVLERRESRIKNSTYLFDTRGEVAFVYDKIHLPPSEVELGVEPGDGACVAELDGLRLGFMTCYDVYFSEQIEYIAQQQPDIVLVPGYQRGERTDIIRAQAKLTAFRCNAFLLRSSFSMGTDEKGGCAMIVGPDGQIIKDLGKEVGMISCEIEPQTKYMRTAGFGGGMVRNDAFISAGLRPDVFRK